MPRASRSRLSCEPSRMRRTTDPLELTRPDSRRPLALTCRLCLHFDQNPSPLPLKASRAITYAPLRARVITHDGKSRTCTCICPCICCAHWEPWGIAQVCCGASTVVTYGVWRPRISETQRGQHSRPDPHRIITAANPGSASHGDRRIDHARAVTAGASAARPLGRLRRPPPAPCRPLRSGAERTGVHPRDACNSGSWTSEFDDVALVVSELVTNALRHALPAVSPSPELTAPCGCI